MDASINLPQSVAKAQNSLRPYIKQRKEAAEIRQILASHLNSCLNHDDQSTLPRPLSLLNHSIDINAPEHGSRGHQKEYLRCVQANNNARKEFMSVSKEHRQVEEDENFGEAQKLQSPDGFSSFTNSYLDVVKQRQKHERLRIVQDYVDVLCQKPATSVEHLDPRLVLRDVESLPKVPSEVLNVATTSQPSSGTDLVTLVDRLEKSVFRAKMLLKNEQRTLAKLKSGSSVPTISVGTRLHALGSTRNELILWMETELACAGDNMSEDQATLGTDARGKEYIEAQLATIHRQYTRYAKSRQRLIIAAAGTLETPSISAVEATVCPTSMEESCKSTHAHITFPYLQQMVAISNDQKAMIQQKSHLTITLAKQLKEASQGFDRLAEESHLLLSHPISAAQSQNKRMEKGHSFDEEISQHEKPDSSHRAKAWVFAAELAGKSTEASISGTIEEGKLTVERAQESLETLRKILGSTELEKDSNTDIWIGLDGTLAVINADGAE